MRLKRGGPCVENSIAAALLYTVRSIRLFYFARIVRHRSQLLRISQKHTAVQQWPPDVGHYGLGRVRLPHGQHGPSSLRDVHPVRQRFVSYSPRPRSGVR